ADALFIATDIGGLYTANPRGDTNAKPIDLVETISPDVIAMAGGSGTSAGTGGMRTKLEAAMKAGEAGIETILFNGTDADALRLMAQGRMRGTRIRPAQTRLAARKHWLRHVPAVQAAAILVDAGAEKALRERGASLLPGGVVDVIGEFARGDMIEIRGLADSRPVARGLTQYSSSDVRRIAR